MYRKIKIFILYLFIITAIIEIISICLVISIYDNRAISLSLTINSECNSH